MPNPKLETYKNKATNTVYDLTDADAQSKLTAILDGTDIDSFGDVETALADKADASDLNAILDGTDIDSFGDVETALAGKQDSLTFDQVPRDQSQNPVKSDGLFDTFVGMYDYLEAGFGWSNKNLLEIKQSSKEVNGITYTINDDGTIKLNGTATSASVLALNKFTGAELKQYGENLFMTGGKDNSTFLTLMTQDWAYTKDDKGSGVEINVSQLTDATEYYVIIQVANGTTLSNYVMSPMIRLVSVIDPSFKKYHESVEEYTFPRSEQRVLGAKNLLKNEAISQTINGVTFTVNADKSIIANGTATARIDLIIARNIILEDGDYLLSGCNGGSYSTYRLQMLTVGDAVVKSCENGDVKIAKSDFNNLSIYSRITIYNGAVIDNVTFKPMLRLATDTDDTYVPYAMTNRELTEKVQGIINAATNAADFAAFKTAIGNL